MQGRGLDAMGDSGCMIQFLSPVIQATKSSEGQGEVNVVGEIQ